MSNSDSQSYYSSTQSNSSIPSMIHPNSSSQTNESNLSSISSGISREKRPRDEYNHVHRPQQNEEHNHLSLGRKKHRKQVQRRKSKGTDSHYRRQEMMRSSSEYCVFDVATLHCR